MNNSSNDIGSERYSSRYTRGFLRMLVNDGQADTDKYVEQFYVSTNYQERLEAIKYLIGVLGKYSFNDNIFVDALKDSCSQVKLYVLRQYNFQSSGKPEIEECLINIAKNDEKLQLRALAIERLSEFNTSGHYDLFFSTSLLKSSKESAAGLRGLYKLDKDKAYQMAKFRADSSSGNLDLAIAEIFQLEGDVNDLDFFKTRLKARSKFNKIDFIRIYLKILGKISIQSIVKSHILFICEDISLTGNTELIQRLIMELYHFISDNKAFLEKQPDLLHYVNKTIDLLLEKDYVKTRRADPFGPL